MSNIFSIADNSTISAKVARIMALPYRRELVSNEDGTWFARVVEFRGCMTEGDTQPEALTMLEDAMREWVTAQLEDDGVIPPPSLATEYSGKFMVRIAPTVHRDLADYAERQGVSLNSFIASVLARFLGSFEVATLPKPSVKVGSIHNFGCADKQTQTCDVFLSHADVVASDEAYVATESVFVTE